jgi:cellulose synthase operon protein C
MLYTKAKSLSALRAFPPFAVICSLLLFGLLACAAAQESPLENAEAEFKSGKYQAAITSFTRLLQSNPNEAHAQRGLLQAYLETGQYEAAERDAKRFLNSKNNEAQTRLMLGEVYAVTGRYNEAITEFEKAGKAEATPIKLRANLRRAELLEMTGKEEAAQEIYKTFVSHYEDNNVESAEELTLIARALVHLDRAKDANDIYLEAIAEDETYLEAHLGGGELYTSKYNYAEAADWFNDALKINPNSARLHLAIAANKRLGNSDEMKAALAQALKINPNYVEAKVFAATVDLEGERQGSASTQLEEALKINPNSLDARALRAAMFWLQNKPAEHEKEVAATLAINPRYGMLYEVLAHNATQTRRYAEAVAWLQKGVQLSPRLWSAHLALGMGLLRMGKMEEGRAEVEAAFKGDPFNLWAKNTLDLLDSMKDYKELKSGDFVIKAAAKENDVLFAYASELLAEAQQKLATKYQFTPRAPIAVEIFPNHEDFAVRALGLPGLGALGVCFGQVIAQDSPSARPSGEFNWGSTLWHEYAHVITLQTTDHLIPRWFSEGLSVFEEHKARPGWGDDWNAQHVKAFADGRWFKIAELDNGFIRPKRADDVGLAYFQASQICHFIEEKYGFNAILEMLRGYKEKKKTPEVLQQALKLSEPDFDREFNNYVRSKVDKYVKALEPSWKNPRGEMSKEDVLKAAETNQNDFIVALRAGTVYFAEKNYDKAAPLLQRSIELFPFQDGKSNAYEMLAEIHAQRGDKAAQAAALEGLIKVDENDYDALKKLAQLKHETGDKARALELLQMSFFVNPFEPAGHALAGNLYLERNEAAPALREFRVALAANPPNIAEAHYNVARAYEASGKKAEARKSVLRALEAAPSFDKAQELLLRLTGQ